MNDSSIDILNAVPLVEVMRGWGYVAVRDGDTSASYICPWHDDHKPSLVVDKIVRHNATDLGFKCFGCGEEGYGALQLAARLMGLPAGRLAKEDLPQVMNEVATRCDVELPPEEGEKKYYDTLRTKLIGWSDFPEAEKQYADWTGEQPIFERGEWTVEGLKALGLKVELATRRARKKDIADGLGETKGESGLSQSTTAAEIKVGDMLTQFDPDTGEPLYRCSIGKDFYRGPQKAETRTVTQWGSEVERLFGVQPVARFIQRVEVKKGGVVIRIVKATRNYPIFMFPYPWGTKKYEPKDTYGQTKWTWWCLKEDADLNHQWYADAQLADALRIRSGELKIEDSCLDEIDERHPYTLEKDKDGKPIANKPRFERVVLCSGPRDAIAVYSHSNAHVVWLHSEQAGFDQKNGNPRPNRWLRSLIKRLQNVSAEGCFYVCYDEDATGLASSQAIALNNPQVRWLRLPRELGQITVGKSDNRKPLKDVTDFITRFPEVEGRMPADVQHDDPVEWFDNALFDTPTCQFWQFESTRKEEDGTTRNRYKFDLRNTPVFLRARGMVRKQVQQGKVNFSRFFLMGNDNTYIEVFPGEKGSNKLVAQARDLMAEWLRAHKSFNDPKGALSRAIYSAKLEQGTMETIEQMDFDEKSYGEDYDTFFFANTAVRVSAGEIKTVGYGQLKQWTNAEAILDGNFSLVPQAWHVEVNSFYETERRKHEEIMDAARTPEEKAQENMRWDSWDSLWHYRLVLDRPLEEMPLHFRFLYNASRIFWEKEAGGKELTQTEKQVQDMYMIAMMHALGSALVRHRSANRQQFVHITDNGTRREDLASGGTGKTAILELLGLMRRVLKVDGKALEGGNITLTQELAKVVPGLHNIVALDELPQGFSPKTLYNYTLSLTARGLYRDSMVLEGDDLPKFVVASNEQLDLSSDSTSRRTYQILVSDWYHPRSMDGSRPAHTPADDFRKDGMKEVARNLSPTLLNEARNLLLGCVRLFFQLPDETIRPPKDSRALLRQALAASKDEQFTRWIAEYLSDRRHLAIPIAQRELAISFLDYCGVTVGEKTLKSTYKRIRDNLQDYIRTSIYVVDPPVVLLTPSDRERGFRQCATWQYPRAADGYSIPLDTDGQREPRQLVRKAPYPRVYYFYLKARVPRHFYDPAHEGDRDYVQEAPNEDPELRRTSDSSDSSE